MAGVDGATVHIDKDNDGTAETNQTLQEGETIWVTDVEAGAHVYTDNGLPVQVDIFTGDIGSNYECRDSALIPTGTWSSDYYTPVSTPIGTTRATTVWLFNAGADDITVNYRRWVTGSLQTAEIDVAAGGYAKQLLTDGTGAEFYTDNGDPFYAYSTTDSNSGQTGGGGNQAWDWSFTLVPRDRLTTQLLVGLGIGRDPTSGVNPAENGNPIWVTPHLDTDTDYTTVYVDYDGDRATGPNTDPNGFKYDLSYSLRNLERAKIYKMNPGTPVSVDASSFTSTTGTLSPVTVSHATGNFTGRLMLVSVTIADDNDTATANVNGNVTYGGVNLTAVTNGDASNTNLARTRVYALASPAVGTANVSVTLNEAVPFTVGVTTFYGANVTNGITSALRAAATVTATGSSSAMTLSQASAIGDLAYEAVGARSAGVGTIAVDADNSSSTTGATTLSVPHTTTSPANLMLVSVTLGDDNDAATANVSGVTYTVGGTTQNLTAVTGGDASNTNLVRTRVYAVASPTLGSGTVTVNTSENVPFTVGVTTFSGANVTTGLTSALRAPTATTGTGSAMAATATSAPGDLVYEAAAARSAGLATITVDATSTNATNDGNSLTVPHTTGSTANLMLVSIAVGDNDGTTPADVTGNVTYGGQTLQRIASANNS